MDWFLFVLVAGVLCFTTSHLPIFSWNCFLDREVFGTNIHVEFASYYVPAPGTPPFQIKGRGPPQNDYGSPMPPMGSPYGRGRGRGRGGGGGGGGGGDGKGE